jgi:hypothetical protein
VWWWWWRWCCGGDEVEVVLWRWWGGGGLEMRYWVTIWWRWIWCHRGVVDAVWLNFSLDTWFSDRCQICWDLQDSPFESLMVSKSVEICRSLCVWLNSIALFWLFGGGLQAETHMPRLSFFRWSSTFDQWVIFWILMGRLILIRDRELDSNGISLGWIVVFFGGLVALECPFIRMGLEVDLY